ncbi:hypothetical protein [Bartonella raoultii]|uniref:hypothetical protein n=1 Tax=Bartonella raoultii TaxID=1457020 RepID=UPI001ABBCBD9|nr:hypothetical protein [Bartonella raoultii]
MCKGEDNLLPYDFRYLAALILFGDVETLLSYRKSFPKGDQLVLQEKFFDSYVKKVHLKRAVVFQKVAKTQGSRFACRECWKTICVNGV